ncbi:MAG: efflux RND transporter periplasmic adaptor subunit [Petrimonas sp.]|nr:efflux RND transporter periplasmic adaptor subunit [Petrimonas sp.]MEA5062177.1 efflux RND transporter periplasmic adaptor subunit [Petrimonas sp.]
MNKNTKITVFTVIGLLILGMAFFPKIKSMFSQDNQQTQTQRPPGRGGGGAGRQPLSVTAMVLQPQTLRSDLYIARGILLPEEEVDLIFETSGKITHIYFQEGSFVNQGELLAKVNDAPLQAELRKLQTQLPLAQDRVYRQGTLLEKDAVSQETYQTVTTELEKLKADIDLVKSRIAQTELRAPFSGVIGLRQVSVGAYASPAVIVSRLTKISSLKLEFSMNENQVRQIPPGAEISFTVANDLDTYKAVVYAVESQLDPKTLTLKARARYANPGGKLKPGISASIQTLIREIPDAIVIPSISSISEMGRDIAYVYKNGAAREVEITKGYRTSSSVQVLSGLSAGDTLLTTGVMQLREGLPVKISEIE